MAEETNTQVEEAAEEFSAAAPPHPGAKGTGETSFGDAEAPAASELKIAQDKADDYLELAKRTQADFENYRKRMARENAQAVDRGVAKLAKELLPALDHLELALRAAEEHGAGDFAKGIRQIQDEMVGALGRVGIQAYSPKGEQFDPHVHEAIEMVETEDAPDNEVLDELARGYMIKDRLLRPAMVRVAKNHK